MNENSAPAGEGVAQGVPLPAPGSAGARKPAMRVILLLAGCALLGWIGWKLWWNHSHISTDNAQIEGHVVPVRAKVGGFVGEIGIRDHQAVKAGDLLARIDDRDYRVRLAQAEAELALALANAGKAGGAGTSNAANASNNIMRGQAEAQVAAARAAAAGARSGIEQALANADKAQKDLERMRSLVAQKMAAPQALDAAEAASRAAQAQVQVMRDHAISAQEQVSASDAALRAASARVDAARAARDLAANQLADTRILSPVSGIVSNKAVVDGQFVQSGQTLLDVVPLDDVWVVANLKETDLGRLKVGAAARIEVDAYGGMKVAGEVESISPATGARFSLLPPDNATGNFTKVVQRVPVRIRVPQSGDALRPLRPGMSVDITIDTDTSR